MADEEITIHPHRALSPILGAEDTDILVRQAAGGWVLQRDSVEVRRLSTREIDLLVAFYALPRTRTSYLGQAIWSGTCTFVGQRHATPIGSCRMEVVKPFGSGTLPSWRIYAGHPFRPLAGFQSIREADDLFETIWASEAHERLGLHPLTLDEVFEAACQAARVDSKGLVVMGG